MYPPTFLTYTVVASLANSSENSQGKLLFYQSTVLAANQLMFSSYLKTMLCSSLESMECRGMILNLQAVTESNEVVPVRML